MSLVERLREFFSSSTRAYFFGAWLGGSVIVLLDVPLPWWSVVLVWPPMFWVAYRLLLWRGS